MMRQSVGGANEIDFSSIVNPALDPWDVTWVRRWNLAVDGAFYISTMQIPFSVAAVSLKKKSVRSSTEKGSLVLAP